MSFFSALFKSLQRGIACPRCMGKGNVDWDDIKRLEKELWWQPGKCAYCEGTGKVSAAMVSKVAAGEAYLTTSISKEERRRLIKKDKDALYRARLMEEDVNNFIQQITFLYFECKIEPGAIATFFLLPEADKLKKEGLYEERKNELLDYVLRAIFKK